MKIYKRGSYSQGLSQEERRLIKNHTNNPQKIRTRMRTMGIAERTAKVIPMFKRKCGSNVASLLQRNTENTYNEIVF